MAGAAHDRCIDRKHIEDSLLDPRIDQPVRVGALSRELDPERPGRRRVDAVMWPRRRFEHRPLRPGEDPAAEDLGNAELVNSAGLQNTVAVMGLGALVIILYYLGAVPGGRSQWYLLGGLGMILGGLWTATKYH